MLWDMQYIAVHHSAVVAGSTPQLFAVDRYHKNKWNMKSQRGWYVGYNYFIDTDGTVTQTRNHDEETIANRGHNCDVPERCDTISICLADNYNRTDAIDIRQYMELCDLIRDLQCQYKNTLTVVGHRDLQKDRTCPGMNFDKAEIDNLDSIECSKTNNDLVDDEKEAQIIFLQATLDSLRAALRRILSNL